MKPFDMMKRRWQTRLRALYRSSLEGDRAIGLRVAATYLVVGMAWVGLSDRVVHAIARNQRSLMLLHMTEGWLFVFVTTIVLYGVTWLTLRARRKAQIREDATERFAQTLIKNLPGVVYACANDAEWTMFYLSPEVERLTGYAPEDLMDNNEVSYASLIHEDDREAVWGEVQAAVEAGKPFRLEYRIRVRDGNIRWVWEQGCAVFSPDGEMLQLEGFVADITDRRLARDQVQRQLGHLEALRVIDRAIMGSMDLQTTLDVVLDQVTSRLGVDAATVLTLNRQSARLQFSAGRGFATQALRHTRLRLGEGYAGRAALQREIVHVEDLRTDPGDLTWSWLAPEEGFVAYYAVPLVAQGELRGVLEVLHRRPLDPEDDWLDYLATLAGQAAIAIDNATLVRDLQHANEELRVAYDQTIEGWARALDLRDDETEGHSRRVTELAVMLAERLGVEGEPLNHIRRGALLHDIGKIGVPDSILLKPGSLSAPERDAMNRHPGYARDLLSPIPFLEPAIEIPYCHHERWDGTGHPRGLVGEDIPLSARIFAVVDVWDALRSDRPYRAAWSAERTRRHIRDQAGSHFDPRVVKEFLTIEPAELEHIGRLATRQAARAST